MADESKHMADAGDRQVSPVKRRDYASVELKLELKLPEFGALRAVETTLPPGAKNAWSKHKILEYAKGAMLWRYFSVEEFYKETQRLCVSCGRAATTDAKCTKCDGLVHVSSEVLDPCVTSQGVCYYCWLQVTNGPQWANRLCGQDDNCEKCTQWMQESGCHVKQSTVPDSGNGLFATADIKQDTRIGLFMGTIVGQEMWDRASNNAPKHIMDQVTDSIDLIKGKLVLMADTGLMRYANAGKTEQDCNCRIDMKVRTYTASLFSTRDIAAGAELLCWYGPEYFLPVMQNPGTTEPVRQVPVWSPADVLENMGKMEQVLKEVEKPDFMLDRSIVPSPAVWDELEPTRAALPHSTLLQPLEPFLGFQLLRTEGMVKGSMIFEKGPKFQNQ